MKFEIFSVKLFSIHPFHYRPFSILVISTYHLHGVQIENSYCGFCIDSHIHSGNVVPLIHLPTLYTVLDEVSTFLKLAFSVGMGSGTVSTLRNKSSAYHYGKLFSIHPFHYRPFSILVISTYHLHGVQIENSYCGFCIDSHIHSGNVVPLIHLPTLYTVLDEVSTFLKLAFSVGMGSGTVSTLRNKSSAYHYGLVCRICVMVYRFMDRISPLY